MTDQDWQTGRPEVGRYIKTRDGFVYSIGGCLMSGTIERLAKREPEHWAWRYTDAPKLPAAEGDER